MSAVIVTFEPELPVVEALLRSLVGEVDDAIIVDNGSAPWSIDSVPLSVRRIQLDSNIGLAAAQNRGVAAARRSGTGLVLLLDQDSRPVRGMTRHLIEALEDASRQGLRVAAVGPCIVDPNGTCHGFVRFAAGRYEFVSACTGELWVRCDLLIASGSLLPVAAIRDIGPMAEDLFIDKVDTEWSLRAAARGYCLIGASNAQLHHRPGQQTTELWIGRWREVRQHLPFRYYYMFRNSLLLRRLPHATKAWRKADRRQQLALLVSFGLLAPDRWRVLRMIARGWWDGLRGMGGSLHAPHKLRRSAAVPGRSSQT